MNTIKHTNYWTYKLLGSPDDIWAEINGSFYSEFQRKKKDLKVSLLLRNFICAISDRLSPTR